jgi:transcription antitermination factor NusG
MKRTVICATRARSSALVISVVSMETNRDSAVSPRFSRSLMTPSKPSYVPEFAPGDSVRLTEGPLAGLEAVITQVLPGKERVRLLLDFLGRETVTEARTNQVIACDFQATLSRFAAVPVPVLGIAV